MAGTEIGPWIIFRDHELADRIGFLYRYLPGRQAAEDMIYRLLEIRRRLDDPANPYLVRSSSTARTAGSTTSTTATSSWMLSTACCRSGRN